MILFSSRSESALGVLGPADRSSYEDFQPNAMEA
jgi:hypothetical protein